MVVRGVYHQPHEAVSDPTELLHLHIEAPTAESLEKAVKEIERIMDAQQVRHLLVIKGGAILIVVCRRVLPLSAKCMPTFLTNSLTVPRVKSLALGDNL